MHRTKTKKSLRKRIKITGTRQVLKRPAGHNHFNAKDSGNAARNKHGQVHAPRAMVRAAKALLSEL